MGPGRGEGGGGAARVAYQAGHIEGSKHGLAASHSLGFHGSPGGGPQLADGLPHTTAATVLQRLQQRLCQGPNGRAAADRLKLMQQGQEMLLCS